MQEQYKNDVVDYLLPLVKQAQVMSQKYDVVVTNPPYMGASGMSDKLSSYTKNHYPDSKTDLFAVFIERCHDMSSQRAIQLSDCQGRPAKCSYFN